MQRDTDASRDASSTDTDDGGPRLVCASCGLETPLIAIDIRRDPMPRCAGCGTRFRGFGTAARRHEPDADDAAGLVLALFSALTAHDLDGATRLLHPAVVWRDEDHDERAHGVEDVRSLWERSMWVRSMWRVSVQGDAVHVLAHERGPGRDDRLVSWLLHVHDGLITSIWVSVLGRESHPLEVRRAR